MVVNVACDVLSDLCKLESSRLTVTPFGVDSDMDLLVSVKEVTVALLGVTRTVCEGVTILVEWCDVVACVRTVLVIAEEEEGSVSTSCGLLDSGILVTTVLVLGNGKTLVDSRVDVAGKEVLVLVGSLCSVKENNDIKELWCKHTNE